MICRDTYNCRKSNRLTTLSGTGASEDSPTASTTVIYTYDANGNTTHDGRKNTDLTYDINGLLQTVSKNSTTKATYHYLADGTKYKIIAPDGSGRMYAGSITYNIAGSGATITSLDGADLAGGEGRIIAEVSGTTTTYKPIYYLKDHLGSIRTILNAQGEVIERNDYYPFGMRTTTGNTYPTFISTTTSNRHLYNGKEKQTIGDVNYLDYGARMYDETIGRWTTQEPLSEKYYSTSQYTYCGNNPIKIIDIFGCFWGDYFNKMGIWIGTDNIDDNKKYLVEDRKEAKQIQANTKAGISVNQGSVNSAVQLPSDAALNEANNVIERTIANGGKREESSIVMNSGQVIRGETGPDPTEEGNIQTANAKLPSIPSNSTISDVEATLHSHPTDSSPINGFFAPFSIIEPSDTDKTTLSQYSTNIIVGRTSKATWLNGITNENPLGIAIYGKNIGNKPIVIEQSSLIKILNFK